MPAYLVLVIKFHIHLPLLIFYIVFIRSSQLRLVLLIFVD